MALTLNILGEVVQLTGNPCVVEVSGGSAPPGSFDYKLMLKIDSPDGKLKRTPLIDAIAPVAGTARFDVSGYVDQPVDITFQYPPAGVVTSYPTRAFNIIFTPGESYIDEHGDPQEAWGSPSSVYQFLKGGSPPRQLALWHAANTNFYKVYLHGGKWLTHRPWGDFVHPLQPVKLCFMVIENVTADFKIRTVYEDRTETTFSTPVTLTPDMLYEFNCNPVDHSVPAENDDGSRIYYYDVWLQNGEVDVNDRFRFHVDHRYCERPFFVIFGNSVGGLDDVFFAGFATEKFGITSTTVYKPQKPDATVFDRTLITVSKQGQNKWELNSGYNMPAQMQHLRDLILARDAWLLYPLLTPTNRVIIPVTVTAFDDVIISRQKDIHEVTIEIEEGHSSQFNFDNRLY